MQWPSLCLICKALTRGSLCGHCLSELAKCREPIVRKENGFTVHSLFSWRESSPPALGWLIRALKEKDRPRFWRELALWTVNRFGPLDGAVLLPVPSARRSHALGFARAVSDWTGCPLSGALLLPEGGWQKGLSRAERFALTFELSDHENLLDYQRMVLIDDVITTGATAGAAYRALGQPKHFSAWCLMDRRPKSML